MEAEFKDFSDIDWDTFLQNLTLTPNLTVINVGDWDDFLKDNNATTIIRHNTDLVHFTPNEENLSGRVEISWDQLNQTEKEKEILRKYGFSPFNKDTALPMTVFYSVLFLAGVPGNFLTCFIILLNSYMKAPPNLFLFNLAIVDIMTLTMVMPMEVFLLWQKYPWPFGSLGCDFLTVISELVTHVSITTMIAFTIERYTAICHPMQPSLHSGRRKTLIIIILIWIVCLIPSFGWTHFSQVKHLKYGPKDEDIKESAICIVSPHEVTTTMTTLTLGTTIVLYIFPMIFLPILYTKIALALRESEDLNTEHSTIMNHPSRHNRRTVVRMQIAVIACFLICWTPFHVSRMMFVIATKTEKWNKALKEIQTVLHYVSGGCYYLSSTANPFLYSLLSKRFRRGFHDVLRYAFGRFFDPSIGHTQSTGAKNQGGPTQSAPGPALSSRRRGSHQKIPLQMVPLHLTHRIRTHCDIDQSRSPQSEKSAQNDSSRHSTTSGRKDTKYKLLYVSKRRGGGLHAQDSSSTSDGLNNPNGSTTSGKCVLSTKSCPPTQSTTTTQNNGGSSAAPPPKQNKTTDEFQFRSAQQSVEQQRELILNSNSKEVGNGSRQQRRKIITLNGFSKKSQKNLQFPNSNNGAESIF